MDSRSPAPKKTRRFHNRSRSGCLTCRARRKRCSEEKPTCIGCRRNFLICTWPKGSRDVCTVPYSDSECQSILVYESPKSKTCSPEQISPASSNVPDVDFDLVFDTRDLRGSSASESACSSSTSLISYALTWSPSTFPNTLATPGAKRLFQHFLESTATMLAARPDPQNPYATCLLSLAFAHDYVMHAVLACSGSHCASSKRDDSAYPIGREHYAVALRAAKNQITRFSLGECKDPVALVALLLTLCQFECVEGNLQGAVLHHLEAAGQILATLTPNFMDSSYRFLIELFTYHNSVSRNVSIGTSMRSNRSTNALLSILETVECSQEYLDGFMFGYAYDLYKLIPQIRELAIEHHIEGRTDTWAAFESVLMRVQQWRPPDGIHSGWDNTLKVASLMYQQALLIYLLCAQHGPSVDARLFLQVEPHLDQFMELMKLLKSTCTEWTTLTWPLMIVASCLRDRARQEYMARTTSAIIQRMYSIEESLKVMRWVWDDPDAYGPYGIEKVMVDRNVRLSVG